MRKIRCDGRTYEVQILSLARPRDGGVLGPPQRALGDGAKVTLLCPVELEIGARFLLENADDREFPARVLGCAAQGDGRFLILGAMET
jgi:hypothetical protein